MYWVIYRVSVQSLSCVRLFATPMDCSMPGFPVHHQLLELTHSIKLVMPSNHLILCCPLLLSPSIFPSIGGFSSQSAFRIRWPKYWSFSFSVSPSHEHPGLISFRLDWLFLLDDLMFLVTFTVGFYSFGPGLTPQMTSGPQSTHLT